MRKCNFGGNANKRQMAKKYFYTRNCLFKLKVMLVAKVVMSKIINLYLGQGQLRNKSVYYLATETTSAGFL